MTARLSIWLWKNQERACITDHMKPPITTYAGLLAAVEALGPPPTGMVRVYRGQNQDYPEITPSGVRHVLRRRAIWHAYTRHLRADLIREGSDLTDEMLQAMGVWLHVISQHYGPGSDFLDVTYSLEMALWFALGELIQNVSHGSIGPPGPPNPATDHPTEVDVWTFRPWNKAAYIYVFDLPKWNGK